MMGLGVAQVLSDRELDEHIEQWEEAFRIDPRLRGIDRSEGPLPVLYAERDRRKRATGLVTRRLQALPDSVWLYLGEPDRQRGQILGKLVEAPQDCEDLQELEQATGRTFEVCCMVVQVALPDASLENRGYGIQLYADLAREVAPLPIISSALRGDNISPDAERTWNSRRLAKQLVVRGKSAWGGDPG